MSKKQGIILILTGTVLLLAALFLFVRNRGEEEQAGQEARQLLTQVRTAMAQQPETENAAPLPVEIRWVGDSAGTEFLPPDPDGRGKKPQSVPELLPVMGILTIPALGVELPVLDQWDYQLLKLAPCRHFGTAETEDLVIAGHNYKTHFAYLSSLKPGDAVTLTDTAGKEHEYLVSQLQVLPETAVEAVQNSGYPLVLYTCTYSGQERVAVFCSPSTVLTGPQAENRPQ